MSYIKNRGVGGSTALDYLVEVRGLTLPEAVSAITGCEVTDYRSEDNATYQPQPSPTPPLFTLPPRHAEPNTTLCVFKCAIDALSPFTLKGISFIMAINIAAKAHICLLGQICAFGFRENLLVYASAGEFTVVRGTVVSSFFSSLRIFFIIRGQMKSRGITTMGIPIQDTTVSP